MGHAGRPRPASRASSSPQRWQRLENLVVERKPPSELPGQSEVEAGNQPRVVQKVIPTAQELV